MRFLKLFEEFTKEGDIIASVSNTPIKLKVPVTDKEKSVGYMYSNGPKPGEGMLFVYPEEEILSFWMKNVSVPLDILFFDSSRNLVDWKKMYPYEGDEEIYYHSQLPAKFALELPGGWIDQNLDLGNTKLEFI